jgi:DNA-binding NarL/FixJ family response regulator
MQNDFQFIIIDDNLEAKRPLVVEAKIKYGLENVILFNKKRDANGTPKQGENYILENLGKKMIVLLDMDLGSGLNGFDILRNIRSKSGQVFFIFTTGQIEKIKNSEWIELINNEAIFFIPNTSSPDEKINLVDKALHQMETRIDCALESWIAGLEEEDRIKPIYASKEGKQWTFNDILREIRENTEEGKHIEKNIITLILDLITRGKRSINP